MNRQELIKKITSKKEFSQLPRRDVELAFEKFDKDIYCDEEKIKFTRDLLRKVFSGFASMKLLSLRDRSPDWVLRKHLSTRERLSYYEKVYQRILKGLGNKISIIDLGAGVNGFSYKYFNKNVYYLAVEAIEQFVKLMNYYFKREKISGKAIHLSLFELSQLKQLIRKTKGKKVVFLFKTIDSLEMLEKDYSKKLIPEIVPLVERVVVSFATESMVKRAKFRVRRNWIVNFLKGNTKNFSEKNSVGFNILDDFELGGERYIVFSRN